MYLIPKKTFGTISGFTKPFFFRIKKKIFFLLSIHSAVNLFSFRSLAIKARTPFLHPVEAIKSNSILKNRTIVAFDKTLVVLDHFIPTTRFYFKKKKITKVIQKQDFFFGFL